MPRRSTLKSHSDTQIYTDLEQGCNESQSYNNLSTCLDCYLPRIITQEQARKGPTWVINRQKAHHSSISTIYCASHIWLPDLDSWSRVGGRSQGQGYWASCAKKMLQYRARNHPAQSSLEDPTRPLDITRLRTTKTEFGDLWLSSKYCTTWTDRVSILLISDCFRGLAPEFQGWHRAALSVTVITDNQSPHIRGGLPFKSRGGTVRIQAWAPIKGALVH